MAASRTNLVTANLEPICKVTMYITDRAYREPVYNTVHHFWTCS